LRGRVKWVDEGERARRKGRTVRERERDEKKGKGWTTGSIL